jgi:hypothetical protein
MGALGSFSIYIYFHAQPIIGQHVPTVRWLHPRGPPVTYNLRQPLIPLADSVLVGPDRTSDRA